MKHYKYVVLKDGAGHWGVSLGYVEFHRDLCETEEIAKGLVDGGGMWEVEHDEKKILFYGKSDDFGYPEHAGQALASCYDGVKEQISDILEVQDKKSDISDYKIYLADELGTSQEIVPIKGDSKASYQVFHNMPHGLQYTYHPSYTSKGIPRVKPKNYDKKKKAKRKAQKQSRRRS